MLKSLLLTAALIVAAGNATPLQVREKRQSTYEKFHNLFSEASGCEGSLSSPSYPLAYPNNHDGFYVIDVPDGYTVSLQVNVDIEESINCVKDSLALFDGPGSDYPLLGQYCGNPGSPISLASTQDQVFVRFLTDSTGSAPGFQISYTAVPQDGTEIVCASVTTTTPPRLSTTTAPLPSACGELPLEISEEFGQITSPDYPNEYANNLQCSWIITVPRGLARVRSHAFSLEESTNCIYDNVEVFDGQTNALLGRYCANSMPEVVATSNVIKVVFTSDEAEVGSGFVIDFDMLYEQHDPCFHTSTVLLEEGAQYEITSPNHPSNYADNAACSWRLVAPEGKRVYLSTTSFSVEENYGMPGYCYDFVHLKFIESGTDGGLFCGNSFAPQPSLPQSVMLSFNTDESVTQPGFRILATAGDYTQNPCTPEGLTINADSGFITSPNYPNRYDNLQTCTWRIRHEAPSMRLHAISFSTEIEGTLCYDHVVISSGNTIISHECGTSMPDVTVDGSEVKIELTTDTSVTRTGFNISFEALYPTTTTLSTSTTTPSTTTSATTTPSTTTSTTTSSTTSSTTTTTTTASTTPGSVDVYFGATTSITFNSRQGYIYSTNYPSYYPNNVDASLVSDLGGAMKSFVFTPETFDVEMEYYCYDWLKFTFTNVTTSTSLIKGPYCSRNTPTVITEVAEQVTITFYTDYSISHPGFKIRFRVTDLTPSPSTIPPPSTPSTTAAPPSQSSCGAPENPSCLPGYCPTIVGGIETSPGNFPWQVMLTTSTGVFFCGGSIISPQWILTASHCVDIDVPSTIRIRAGVHQMSEPANLLAVSEIRMHPGYNQYSLDNDVALVKLASPLAYTDRIKPVCLASSSDSDFSGQDAVVTGWGTTSEGGSVSNVLMQVQIQVNSNTSCFNSYPGEITPRMMCASVEGGGKDSCQGDSGGPLVVRESGVYKQVGIVSWGYGCARPNQPGVYSRISALRDWIDGYVNL